MRAAPASLGDALTRYVQTDRVLDGEHRELIARSAKLRKRREQLEAAETAVADATVRYQAAVDNRKQAEADVYVMAAKAAK